MGYTFHHIALKVKDFDATVQFLMDVLDVKVRAKWGSPEAPIAMLKMDDGGILEVFGGGTDADEVNARYFHLAVNVEDVDAMYEKALAAGATSHMAPADARINEDLGLRIAFVVIPGGAILEFLKEM